MSFRDDYNRKVKLLLKCLPIVAKEKNFALKGGTAINFFYQDFPRLSIDIDLTFVPIKARDPSLIEIEKGLLNIKETIEAELKPLKVKEQKSRKLEIVVKIIVSDGKDEIKIEPNLTLRGCVYPCQTMNLCKKAENFYNVGVYGVPVLSKADVYAGKICAALDRQHPRDLFDVGLILDNGISEEIKNAFIIYLASNNRPMCELLAPNFLNVNSNFTDEFLGMANIDVSLEQLLDNRVNLLQEIKNCFTEQDKKFLLSIKQGEPDYSLFSVKGVEKLPAIAWKLYNIHKMDKQKHIEHLQKLKRVLGV